MSLEQAMVDLAAALNRNSDLLEVLTSKAKSATAPKTEEPTKPVEKAEEPVKRTRAKAEEAPKAEEPVKRTRAKAEKAPTEAQMVEATKTFLDVEEEDEFQDRRSLVKKIVGHYGVDKMSQIAEESRQEALNMLEAYKAGDDPFPAKRSKRDEDDMA